MTTATIDTDRQITWLMSQVGFVEGTNNANPYGVWQGAGGHSAYCDSAAQEGAVEHGGYRWPPHCQFGWKGDAYTVYTEQRAKELGLWRPSSYDPNRGDQVEFSWNRNGVVDHIETVVRNNHNGTFVTVGFNTGSPEGCHYVLRDFKYVNNFVALSSVAAARAPVPGAPPHPALTHDAIAVLADGDGYWVVASDGGVFAFGSAGFFGSRGGEALSAPIVGAAVKPGGKGYWLAGADGKVYSFGSASVFKLSGALNQAIVGAAPTPSGRGLWLVAADGGVFAFGDAGFFGSTGAARLNAPMVGMAPTPSGRGLWLVAADGGVFAFGDAGFHGSTGSLHLNAPVTGLVGASDGQGYWLVAADGGVFAFGSAQFRGAAVTAKPAAVRGMAATADGSGYWLVARDGAVYAYGDAGYHGGANAT